MERVGPGVVEARLSQSAARADGRGYAGDDGAAHAAYEAKRVASSGFLVSEACGGPDRGISSVCAGGTGCGSANAGRTRRVGCARRAGPSGSRGSRLCRIRCAAADRGRPPPGETGVRHADDAGPDGMHGAGARPSRGIRAEC